MKRAAVIDTGVFVAGPLTADPASRTALIVDAMLGGRIRFLLSEELLAEYREVLRRPRIRSRHGMSDDEIDQLLTELVVHGVFRTPPASPQRSPDPRDQHLWDLVTSLPDAVLFTGDRKLLDNPPSLSSALSAPEFFALEAMDTEAGERRV